MTHFCVLNFLGCPSLVWVMWRRMRSGLKFFARIRRRFFLRLTASSACLLSASWIFSYFSIFSSGFRYASICSRKKTSNFFFSCELLWTLTFFNFINRGSARLFLFDTRKQKSSGKYRWAPNNYTKSGFYSSFERGGGCSRKTGWTNQRLLMTERIFPHTFTPEVLSSQDLRLCLPNDFCSQRF